MMTHFTEVALSYEQEPQLEDGDVSFANEIGEWFNGDNARKIIELYSEEIEQAGIACGINPNLIRAIIFEEQSHLDPIENLRERYLGIGNTVGLGQITVGKHGRTREELLDDKININTVAQHLKFLNSQPLIQPNAPIASLATIYNCGSCKSVTAYGRRVVSYFHNFERGDN